MKIMMDEYVDAASIYLEVPARGMTRMVRDDVIATVHEGELTALELLRVSQHGPLDTNKAELLCAWAREQLGLDRTA